MYIIAQLTLSRWTLLLNSLYLDYQANYTLTIGNNDSQEMFDNHQRILEPAGALALARVTQFAKYYDCKGEDLVAITIRANFEDFGSDRLLSSFQKSFSMF